MTEGKAAPGAGGAAVTPRVLVVWCPDWPVTAVGGDAGAPVAVVAGGRILACSDAARAAGVRQGQRLKLAQRLCPALQLRDRDPEAETRRFEPVVAAVEAFTPRVEVLRPGLCAIPVKGPSRYFGGEEALAAKVQAAVAAALARPPAERSGSGPAGGAGPDAGPQPPPADAEAGAAHPAGSTPARADTDRGTDPAPTAGTPRRERGAAAVTPLHPADADRAGARRRAAAVDELFAAAPAAR
ncbi:hypothetical protein MCM47_40295, partial [Kitasatospora sp. A2-31]|nr:hypothetical protein [Kitasatospora sp. A2-31]